MTNWIYQEVNLVKLPMYSVLRTSSETTCMAK